jgi:hypothetical protein
VVYFKPEGVVIVFVFLFTAKAISVTIDRCCEILVDAIAALLLIG